MSSSEVKNQIIRCFKISKYVVLSNDHTGNKLVKCGTQDIDGEAVANRKGSLYLCENFDEESDDDKEVFDSDSNYTPSPRTKRSLDAADAVMKELRADTQYSVYNSDDDFVSPSPNEKKTSTKVKKKLKPVEEIVISSDSGGEGNEVNPPKQRKFDIEETRRIRAIQDQEYAESLAADRAKAERKAEEEREERANEDRHRQLKEVIKNKYSGEVPSNGSKRCSIRFPDGLRLDIAADSIPPKMLYEIVYGFGPISHNFELYTSHPRRVVAVDADEDCLGDQFPLLLYAEINKDSPDLIDFLSPTDSAMVANASDTPKMQVSIVETVDNQRREFMDQMKTRYGLAHKLSRVNLYEDCLHLCEENLPALVGEYPFRVSFEGERAIDIGGVLRDMISGFWETSYVEDFDGANAYIPGLHPHTDLTKFKLLGSILAHGFMSCVCLPNRLSFPVIAYTLLGMDVSLPDSIIIDSFIDYVSVCESAAIRDALSARESPAFQPQLRNTLITLLGNMGCRQVPTPQSIQQLIVRVARYELTLKPAGALREMNAGVPKEYLPFLSRFSVSQLFELYKSLNATCEKVLSMIDAPDESLTSSNHIRVLGYLKTFVGNLSSRGSVANGCTVNVS